MATSRTRVQTLTSPGGVTIVGNNAPGQYQPYTRIRDTCIDFWKKKKDVNGMLPPSNATIVKRHVISPGWISGKRDKDLGLWYISKASSRGQSISPSFPTGFTSRDKGNPQYTNELLARTQPYRATFPVAVFFRELLEILTLFSLPTKSIANLAGGSYLNVKFGWMTFARDIKTLDGIVKDVDSRVRELNSIMKKGGIRRNIRLDGWTMESNSNVSFNSSPVPSSHSGTEHIRATREVRGSVRWFLAPGAWRLFEDMTPLDRWNTAVSAVFGAESITVQDAWNILPFSWLVDYLVDIDSYLGSMYNKMLFYPDHCCIIREDKLKLTGRADHPLNTPWQRMTDVIIDHREYRRVVVAPTGNFPTRLNLISKNQATTAAALLLALKK